MEAQETAAQDILKCIQKLEHYNSYRTIPDDGFSEFKECVISAVEWTFHLIQSNELEIAMQLLDLLDNLESVRELVLIFLEISDGGDPWRPYSHFRCQLQFCRLPPNVRESAEIE